MSEAKLQSAQDGADSAAGYDSRKDATFGGAIVWTASDRPFTPAPGTRTIVICDETDTYPERVGPGPERPDVHKLAD